MIYQEFVLTEHTIMPDLLTFKKRVPPIVWFVMTFSVDTLLKIASRGARRRSKARILIFNIHYYCVL